MDIKKAIIEAVVETAQIFGLNIVFNEETEVSHQFTGEPVNVFIGLADGIKGNVIIGFKKPSALSIVSTMMGGMEVSELDFMAKSALGELGNMALGSALMKMKSDKAVNLSPPTVAVGDDVAVTVSGNNSTKFIFDLNGEKFNIVLSQG